MRLGVHTTGIAHRRPHQAGNYKSSTTEASIAAWRALVLDAPLTYLDSTIASEVVSCTMHSA